MKHASAGRSRAGFNAERSCCIGAVAQVQVNGSCADAAAAEVVPQPLLPLQRRPDSRLLLHQMIQFLCSTSRVERVLRELPVAKTTLYIVNIGLWEKPSQCVLKVASMKQPTEMQ